MYNELDASSLCPVLFVEAATSWQHGWETYYAERDAFRCPVIPEHSSRQFGSLLG
jgi:hypothetical protein